MRFEITTVEPDSEYTDTALFFGARLVFRHTAEAFADGTRLAVHVAIDGPLSLVWGLVLRRGFEKSAQADLDRLVALVEGR
ncbi:hypothetical protein ABH922_003984 [Rhodococcus sp. 27YEA15]